jgi:hypothetical protein
MRQHGFRLGSRAAQFLLAGQQDEPAALAYLLDEVGLQPGDGTAQAVAEAASEHGRLQSLRVLLERGWLGPDRVDLAALLRGYPGRCGPGSSSWRVSALCGAGAGQHALTAVLFASAAVVGSVPLLQQLRYQGCPWREDAWRSAAWAGCEALLEWLHAEACPMPVSAASRCSSCSLPLPCSCRLLCMQRVPQ